MPLTVLGLGNILMADDGVGVRLMEAVRDARDWPGDVRFVDGGAGGLGLLNVIEEAERICAFDAADLARPPGDYATVSSDQLADDTPEHRVSMHDMPLFETLRLSKQFFRAPDRVEVFAVQPASVDYARDLSPAIRARWEELTTAAVQWLAERV